MFYGSWTRTAYKDYIFEKKRRIENRIPLRPFLSTTWKEIFFFFLVDIRSFISAFYRCSAVNAIYNPIHSSSSLFVRERWMISPSSPNRLCLVQSKRNPENGHLKSESLISLKIDTCVNAVLIDSTLILMTFISLFLFIVQHREIERAVYSGILVPSADWHSLTHEGGSSSRRPEGSLRLTYRVRVQCDPNYYNATCMKFCRPRDDKFGHYTCDDQGDKACLPGWTGANCETGSNWFFFFPFCLKATTITTTATTIEQYSNEEGGRGMKLDARHGAFWVGIQGQGSR